MQFTCKTVNLNKGIQIVQKAISSKPSTPIFSGIHIIAENNRLKLHAIDLNMATASDMEAEVIESGEIVVSAKHFADLIRKLPDENVMISKNEEENIINIHSDKSEFQLLLMSEEDYPKFPEINAKQQIIIEDDKIKELIKKTIYACANDESRPLFTGILFEITANKITCVGTNTHRLAIKSIEQTNDEDLSVIIPSKVLSEISRNLNVDIPEDVKLSILDRKRVV